MSRLEPKSWDLAASPLFTSPQSLPWSRSHRTYLCETENHTSNEFSKASVFGENDINLQIKNKQTKDVIQESYRSQKAISSPDGIEIMTPVLSYIIYFSEMFGTNIHWKISNLK